MLTLKKNSRKFRTFADHGWYALLLLLSLILLSAVTSCQRNEVRLSGNYDTFATIRDLRGLDGCEFVLHQ